MYFPDEDLLYNPRLRRGYRIEDGIPVMLAERAEPVPEPEHERLMARARQGAATMAVQLPGREGSRYPVTARDGIAAAVVDGSRTPAWRSPTHGIVPLTCLTTAISALPPTGR